MLNGTHISSTRCDVSSHPTRAFDIINTIFLPFPTCTMSREIIFKGYVATQMCAGQMCKCGSVKGSEEGLSGNLRGSVKDVCGWLEGVIGILWRCNFIWTIFCFTHSSNKKSSNVLLGGLFFSFVHICHLRLGFESYAPVQCSCLILPHIMSPILRQS